jgi:hypothetical protein
MIRGCLQVESYLKSKYFFQPSGCAPLTDWAIEVSTKMKWRWKSTTEMYKVQ